MKSELNPNGDVWISTDEAIAGRQAPYFEAWRSFRSEIDALKAQYGSWAQIPNKERTRLANNLRGVGWIYNPVSGWECPNSVGLS